MDTFLFQYIVYKLLLHVFYVLLLSGEEHSRVQAHIDGDEFSAHILTDEAEYNVEVREHCKV